MYANALRGGAATGETSMKALSVISALLAGTMLAGLVSPARADDVADFYRGKRISLIIGYGSGGGYDDYARMLGRFIGDHIPGKPTVVPQNMPGAGSRSAANWLYNVAPKDGTVIATLSQATPTDQALGQPGVQFDARKFNWIGNMVVVNNFMFVWAATGVKTIDDAKKQVAGDRRQRRELAVGALSAGVEQSARHQIQDRRRLSGRRRHQHRGRARRGRRPRQQLLGVDEVDASRTGSGTTRSTSCSRSARSARPTCPTCRCGASSAQNDEQRQVLEMLSGDAAVGRPILTAPDVPADRVKALRKAFDDTLRDPAFIAAAKQAKMYFNPMTGEELQQIVAKIASPPERILAMVKQAIEIKDVQKKGL